MEVAIKKQTTFRLDSDLLDALKSAGKREHRSLNNFVECILREVIYTEPNEETKKAIVEARADKNLKKVDMSSFENFIKSCSE
ncbi:toxin-antitoxin system protein [Bacteroides thetaiotaomicron]|uniref:Toxin-antitoxin system protein n=1 Tax=Bacteroides thetaiotaomicron TaxID=818 RepID=A0AAP3SEQ6_BACT4|nr:toxin-antitoxin system protein [Bacteroides thetaiotaomicron]MDC2220991.1 toxin-antitoxin system protein [Bacteroides thetaiotaomicron]MDC2228183.1 toxin-antitoxin system protein [Bacteroides thetaiotaomicron]MDC2236680.1 toxin-antitoxin system protein [Bacteroides thetaiotaomicron]